MNSKEFIKALNFIEKEKGIDKEVVFEGMEAALMAAYKREYGVPNSKVLMDRKSGEISVYSYLTVVEDLDDDDDERYINEDIEISLTDARKIDKTLNVGDTIDTLVTPHDFGRVATSTAKQVLTQKIREAERAGIQELYGDKQDELLIGTVDLEDTDNYYINLGKINGVLPKKECIPGEKIVMGSQLKVYVTKVDLNSKGMLVLLSRTHYAFLKRLFEIDIPEINDGTILVHSVARDAGSRSKVAVSSINDRIDPIGSCIGEKGSRIANILKEINGEKIDIVKYDSDPSIFIQNALAPAKNLKVLISDPKKNEAMVIADKENFTLAIGKKGQNARLASRLTKYKIDIKTIEDASDMGISFREE